MRKILTLIPTLMFVALQTFSQDSITTLRPAVTYDTNAICVGSVIDVPFYSWGAYNAGNNYIAQISDSGGNFSANPTIIGSDINDNSAYNGPPGYVKGVVPDVPDGCHYYIRVTSSNPDTIGAVYGPICIQHCDIKTNNGEDLHLCLVPNNTIIDTPINIQIHYWDSVQVYNSGNIYELELLSTTYLTPIIPTGALGEIIATTDTSVMLYIPGITGMQALGIAPGSYYLRVVATNTLYPDSSFGSMIRFVIGMPTDIPPAIDAFYYPSGDPVLGSICPGSILEFNANPYDPNSSYEWYGGFVGDSLNNPALLINFSNVSFYDFPVSLRQINYGCRGSLSYDTIFVSGLPQVNISSPVFVCIHDTNTWSVPYSQNTYNLFSSAHGLILDSTSNTITIRFDSLGDFTLTDSAINQCGSAVGNKIIHVIAPPAAYITDSISSMTVYFSDSGTIQNYTSYHWQFGDTDSANDFNPIHAYSIPGSFEVILTVTNQCASITDSINLNIIDSCSAQFTLYPDTSIAHHYFIINNATGIPPIHYDWSWGDSSPDDTIPYPSHTYADSGYYTICLSIIDSTGCQSTYCDSSYHILRTADYMVYVNVISPAQVGIKEVNANLTSVNIYPNPNSGTFTLSYHLSPLSIPNSELIITDVTGRMLYSYSIYATEGRETFSLPLSSGTYFYQLLNDGGIIGNGKVVIMK